jgi:hypothetical protein
VVIAGVAAVGFLALWPGSAAPAVPHSAVTYPVVLRSQLNRNGFQLWYGVATRLSDEAFERTHLLRVHIVP